MNREQQIRDLEASLSRLVGILGLDPRCQWTQHFQSCLAQTRGLIAGSFSQDEISALSSSVMHVYGGMGSFNDYAPGAYDSASGKYVPIQGAGRFDEISAQVYEEALALRVVGNAP